MTSQRSKWLTPSKHKNDINRRAALAIVGFPILTAIGWFLYTQQLPTSIKNIGINVAIIHTIITWIATLIVNTTHSNRRFFTYNIIHIIITSALVITTFNYFFTIKTSTPINTLYSFTLGDSASHIDVTRFDILNSNQHTTHLLDKTLPSTIVTLSTKNNIINGIETTSYIPLIPNTDLTKFFAQTLLRRTKTAHNHDSPNEIASNIYDKHAVYKNHWHKQEFRQKLYYTIQNAIDKKYGRKDTIYKRMDKFDGHNTLDIHFKNEYSVTVIIKPVQMTTKGIPTDTLRQFREKVDAITNG